jgi:hypothetical protein
MTQPLMVPDELLLSIGRQPSGYRNRERASTAPQGTRDKKHEICAVADTGNTLIDAAVKAAGMLTSRRVGAGDFVPLSASFHALRWNATFYNSRRPGSAKETIMVMRSTLATIGFLAWTSFAGMAPAAAQNTDVRFVLDFLLQGQQSPFVLGRERGYYTAQGVNFTAFDSGRGGADSITKVASGAYDVGFGDLSALIEFNAKNPGRELIAVALIYEKAPLSFI